MICFSLKKMYSKKISIRQILNDIIDLEESRENSPARYKENPQNVPTAVAPNSNLESAGIDNIGLDVDFPKVFQHMRKEQGLP